MLLVFFVILSCRSVYRCLAVTCSERADLLALDCDVYFFVKLSFSYWYPGSGVVLYCIDS